MIPTCTGSRSLRSAMGAASTGSILANCKKTISTNCEEVSMNTTLTGTCSNIMKEFETKTTKCRTEGCSCWRETADMKSSISQCSAFKAANDMKEKKKTSLKTFGACKKAQDSAVEITATCP